MPWLGWYSFMRTWLIGDGNSPDSSDILCVKFVNHGGTTRETYHDILAEKREIKPFNHPGLAAGR